MKGIRNAKSLINNWFKSKNWQAFDFQKAVWNAYLEGNSGLLHSTTGSGKTLAVAIAPILEWIAGNPNYINSKEIAPLTILWVTPLRALAEDTTNAILKPINELCLPWSVESRTGDTPQAVKKKQKNKLPTVLITTPESLSVLLSYPNSIDLFSSLKLVVCDEWHELLSSKRGVMTELCLAHLKPRLPNMRIWGVSATLGNTNTAMEVLLGVGSNKKVLIEGKVEKQIIIESIIPDEIEHFPQVGHLGLSLLPQVVREILSTNSVLVFTNTRAQCEAWFQAIVDFCPELIGKIALHHGSLEKDTRQFVEQSISNGRIKCVVCTSSLDLGVDFSPVDIVIQIGSPKGVARFQQRAGRSGHRPGVPSKIIFVPTNAFELIEIVAVREAIKNKKIEPREPYLMALDVLSQHCVTLALANGFKRENLFNEVKSTYSFQDLTEEDFDWVLEFITKGGKCLYNYADFHKVIIEDDNYIVTNKQIALRHRLSIGTITGDNVIKVKYLNGPNIGSIEENFISKLSKGDVFIFSGKVLEFVHFKDMTAFVKKSKAETGVIPQWMGGRMPLSTELADSVRNQLNLITNKQYNYNELSTLEPIFEVQRSWSSIPRSNELLLEKLIYKKKYYYFIYPFEGFLANEGLASLLAYRISQTEPITFKLSVSDYGFQLLTDKEIDIKKHIENGLFNTHNLKLDLLESVNSVEIARRHFREIARVAGLTFIGYPGAKPQSRHLQASGSNFFDVFRKFDSDNMIYQQAFREVLNRQLEINRIESALKRMENSKLIIKNLDNPSPFCFPIMTNFIRASLSSEKVSDRIEKLKQSLEKEILKRN